MPYNKNNKAQLHVRQQMNLRIYRWAKQARNKSTFHMNPFIHIQTPIKQVYAVWNQDVAYSWERISGNVFGFCGTLFLDQGVHYMDIVSFWKAYWGAFL